MRIPDPEEIAALVADRQAAMSCALLADCVDAIFGMCDELVEVPVRDGTPESVTSEVIEALRAAGWSARRRQRRDRRHYTCIVVRFARTEAPP